MSKRKNHRKKRKISRYGSPDKNNRDRYPRDKNK